MLAAPRMCLCSAARANKAGDGVYAPMISGACPAFEREHLEIRCGWRSRWRKFCVAGLAAVVLLGLSALGKGFHLRSPYQGHGSRSALLQLSNHHHDGGARGRNETEGPREKHKQNHTENHKEKHRAVRKEHHRTGHTRSKVTEEKHDATPAERHGSAAAENHIVHKTEKKEHTHKKEKRHMREEPHGSTPPVRHADADVDADEDEPCQLVVEGDRCHISVTWAMNAGIHEHPAWYPGATPHSSFADFQSLLHRSGHGDCPEPCSVPVLPNLIGTKRSTLRSGDALYFRLAAGAAYLDVRGGTVQARTAADGDLEPVVIEKNGGGPIQPFDTVFLRTRAGRYLDVAGEAVRLAGPQKNVQHEFVIEAPLRDGWIQNGDLAYLWVHTGKLLDIHNGQVRARWRGRGDWQRLLVEKKGAKPAKSHAVNHGPLPNCDFIYDGRGCEMFNEWNCLKDDGSSEYRCCCPGPPGPGAPYYAHDHSADTTPSVKIPSLFCVALMMPAGYEVGLVRAQLARSSAGLRSCNEWALYSNSSVLLSPSISPSGRSEAIWTDVMPGDLTAPIGGVFHSALNTRIFIRFWDKVLTDRRTWRNDWTLKTDPDCVFLPARVRGLLQGEWHPQGTPPAGDPKFARGVWVNNCQWGMHGPIEVMSRQAVVTYRNERTRCTAQNLEQQPQEDVYLRNCMNVLGVTKVNIYNILLEDGWGCNERASTPDHRPPCFAHQAAFHPFKSIKAYMNCYTEAASEPWPGPIRPISEDPGPSNGQHA